jgi:hypothetical protein
MAELEDCRGRSANLTTRASGCVDLRAPSISETALFDKLLLDPDKLSHADATRAACFATLLAELKSNPPITLSSRG